MTREANAVNPSSSLTTPLDPREPTVDYRPVGDADAELLFRIYASTRTEEMALVVDWDAARKESFLRMQFEAQDRYCREHYPGAEYRIILVDGEPAGRLYLHSREREIRIMDIALLPDYRRKGLGTALLREIQNVGEAESKIVSIYVEIFNPAQRLYARLGFTPVAENGMYRLMEWLPSK